MTSNSLRFCFLPIAGLALSGSIALAQAAPANPAPPAPPAPSTAPAPRANPRPRMVTGRPAGDFRERMMDRGREFRGREHGRMGGAFHIGPEGMWWKNPRVVENLSITPDQVKRMDGIFQESRLKLIDLRANVQKQEVMLEPLLSANTLDAPKAQAQIDKVADARAELEKANARMLLGIRGVLTPDQWTKLHDRRGPGEPGGPGGMHGHGGPGGGPGGPRGGNGNMDNLVGPDLEPGL